MALHGRLESLQQASSAVSEKSFLGHPHDVTLFSSPSSPSSESAAERSTEWRDPVVRTGERPLGKKKTNARAIGLVLQSEAPRWYCHLPKRRLLRQRRPRRRADGGGWGVRARLDPADRRLIEALREHHRRRLFSCGTCGDAEDQGSGARLMGFAIGDRPIEAGKLGDLGIGKGRRTEEYRGGSSRSRRRHRQRTGNLDVGRQ
jgi:hypothetical protein